eukprot:TRINITY_DN1225_c0_g1_i1.p10 TRINITY_DN1225_c0_g1~~TRINITY_DN1225_c0_g1_i1.p10  ORF type:complete len:115 (-),score=4.05 TRINITY_DN1225_c0_g1_i1:222-566(-)
MIVRHGLCGNFHSLNFQRALSARTTRRRLYPFFFHLLFLSKFCVELGLVAVLRIFTKFFLVAPAGHLTWEVQMVCVGYDVIFENMMSFQEKIYFCFFMSVFILAYLDWYLDVLH